MTSTHPILLAVAIVCSPPWPHAHADDKPVRETEPLKQFVAHLKKNGIELKHDEGRRWIVVDAKADGYETDVYLLTFPAAATEKEMKYELMTINLYFMLNAKARLAMSRPGMRIFDQTKKIPKPDQLPDGAKIEKLFKEWRGKENKE